jgi:hypothetical protein
VTPATQLAQRLFRTPPREARVVYERVVAGKTRAEAAAYWGVSREAGDVMLWRAAQAFQTGSIAPAAPFGLEATSARALADALEGSPAAPEIAALNALLQEVLAQKAAVDAAWRELQRAAEASPGRRAETWARRAAIVAIVALTAYFYWREKNKPPEPRPRLEERIPIRR